jgi:hypothetical protein
MFCSWEEGEVAMRRRTVFLLFAMVVALLAAAGVALAQQDTAPSGGAAQNVIDGRYIVVLDRGVDNPTSVARAHARKYGADIRYVYHDALKGYAANIPDRRLGEVRNDPRVSFVSADRAVHATAQSLPTGVDRIQGDASSSVSGNRSGSVDTAVAIIDTGIDVDHPDLNVKGAPTARPVAPTRTATAIVPTWQAPWRPRTTPTVWSAWRPAPDCTRCGCSTITDRGAGLRWPAGSTGSPQTPRRWA